MNKKKPASPVFSKFKSVSNLTIVDPDQAKKADLLICIRVADAAPASMFINGQRIGECIDCGERVLISPTAPAGVPPLCHICYDLRPEESDIQMHVTKATIAEFVEAIVAHERSMEPDTNMPVNRTQSDPILSSADRTAKRPMLQ
jgi:hypothetical protein